MLYLCMSIAGSIPVILCFLLWVFQRQSYNYQLGKRLLLIGMFFYLVPFQVVKFLFPDEVVSTLSFPINVNVKPDLHKIVQVKSILSPGESLWIPKWIFTIVAVWLCCIIVFSVYQIVKYRIDMKKLLAHSEKVLVDMNGNSIELLINQHIHSPYTVGFIKQSIIVPDGSWKHPCFHMVYRHEEQHWKNHDSLMKLICIIIICIHFVNPIAILLLFLYSVTAEYVCDGTALEGYSDVEKKEYARLLVEASTENEPLSMVWRNNLSCSAKLMRRRINYIMKRNGMAKKGFWAFVTVVAVFVSSSTILAYEPFKSSNKDADEVVSSNDLLEFSSENNEFSIFSGSGGESNVSFGDSDIVFVYEDGTQVSVNSASTDENSYALCIHNLQSGYVHAHKANSSGGCTVTIYNAKQCTKCGYLEIGSVYNVITYAVCPHN